ncbi:MULTISPECIES: RNA polymerase sigma factor [Bacillus]|uniref:RNA polymerase sigma factor n=1 Tax=Bacillus TaxID=1386 RepID=UPI0012FF597A|nr:MULTISPECIES: RNA polymerase sigma factor [Bacillus]
MSEKKLADVFLREVYRPYYQDVYQYCLYLTNHKEEALDLTQDTFLKAMKSIERYQGRSNLRTWIMSIARNTTIDSFRKKKFQRLLPMKWGKEQTFVAESPENSVGNKAEWQVLQEALTTLKDDYRQVIILRALKEFSPKEVSEILGWSESKVRVTYHRAIEQMRKKIGKDEEGVLTFERTK